MMVLIGTGIVSSLEAELVDPPRLGVSRRVAIGQLPDLAP
jgi:hypothetical protein